MILLGIGKSRGLYLCKNISIILWLRLRLLLTWAGVFEYAGHMDRALVDGLIDIGVCVVVHSVTDEWQTVSQSARLWARTRWWWYFTVLNTNIINVHNNNEYIIIAMQVQWDYHTWDHPCGRVWHAWWCQSCSTQCCLMWCAIHPQLLWALLNCMSENDWQRIAG